MFVVWVPSEGAPQWADPKLREERPAGSPG